MTEKILPTQMVTIEKNIPGALELQFQDAQNYSNPRTVTIDARARIHRVPVNIAASMFQIEGTYNLYKKGYFTFQNNDKEVVFNYARELQIYYGNDDSGKKANYEQPADLMSVTQISTMVSMGRTKQIKEVLDGNNPTNIQMLVNEISENPDKITQEIIKLVEEKTGVPISLGDA